MLHHGQQDHVSFANEFSTPRLCHEVDALGRAAREDDLVRTCRADVLRDASPRAFIRVGGAPAQRVESAMHIRVVVLIKIPQRLDHWAPLLRTRSAIKVYQVMAAHLLTQDREILAKAVPIDSGGSKLVHAIICCTRRNAPLYSKGDG